MKDYKEAFKYSMLRAHLIYTIYNDQLASYSEEMDTRIKPEESSEKIVMQELEIQRQSTALQRVLFAVFALFLLSTGSYLIYFLG